MLDLYGYVCNVYAYIRIQIIVEIKTIIEALCTSPRFTSPRFTSPVQSSPVREIPYAVKCNLQSLSFFFESVIK